MGKLLPRSIRRASGWPFQRARRLAPLVLAGRMPWSVAVRKAEHVTQIYVKSQADPDEAHGQGAYLLRRAVDFRHKPNDCYHPTLRARRVAWLRVLNVISTQHAIAMIYRQVPPSCYARDPEGTIDAVRQIFAEEIRKVRRTIERYEFGPNVESEEVDPIAGMIAIVLLVAVILAI